MKSSCWQLCARDLLRDLAKNSFCKLPELFFRQKHQQDKMFWAMGIFTAVLAIVFAIVVVYYVDSKVSAIPFRYVGKPAFLK